MKLAILHPEVAFRDCEHCRNWLYNEHGENAGQIAEWRGEPYRRPPGVPVPCKTSRGCPKVSPDAGVGLSPQNLRAYLFDRGCRAVGRWPDDPIVRRNARIIQDAEAEARRELEKQHERRRVPHNRR